MNTLKFIAKFLISIACIMWVMVSGISIAFFAMCEGTIELKAKPVWFIILAILLTSMSAFNILLAQFESIPAVSKRRSK